MEEQRVEIQRYLSYMKKHHSGRKARVNIDNLIEIFGNEKVVSLVNSRKVGKEKLYNANKEFKHQCRRLLRNLLRKRLFDEIKKVGFENQMTYMNACKVYALRCMSDCLVTRMESR